MIPIYKDPLLKKIIDLIKNNNNQIRTYYYGDPVLVPKSVLPACFVCKDMTSINSETTQEDRHRRSILIKIVVDAQSDFMKSPDQVVGINTLYQICDGLDDNGNPLPSSIAYILRHNQNLDSVFTLCLDDPLDIKFPDKLNLRGENLLTLDTEIRFKVTSVHDK